VRARDGPIATTARPDARAVRVLVTASPAVRRERLAAERRIAASEAERAIRDEDAGRADYLRRFYDVQEGHGEHYDLGREHRPGLAGGRWVGLTALRGFGRLAAHLPWPRDR
jgi:hypothetical protein